MAAKEVVVSTLSVLYTGNADDDSQALSERLKQDRNAEGNLVFTPLIAISLMLFVLIYGKNVTDFLLVLFPAGIHQFFMNRILSF